MAASIPASPPASVRQPSSAENEILTDAARAFLTDLHHRFDGRRLALLKARAARQARFDALREREAAGTLTQNEREELAGMIEEIERAEAASLQSSAEREEAECLRLEAQNADLSALLQRRQALASKLERVLDEAAAEEKAIKEELAQILDGTKTVSGATTG